MKKAVVPFSLLLSAPAFAGGWTLSPGSEMPAPAAIAVVLLGIVGIVRRRRL